MYTKILVPLDGSKLSEGILPHARSFARALKVPVELLHAIEPEIINTFSDPGRGRFVDIVEADMKRNTVAYLESVRHSFPDPSIVQPFAVLGKPAEVIMDRAAAQPGTLIAMATHGRSGIRRWLLGSVADKVLHATTNHMLFVRPSDESKREGEATLKTVLVPLDGSGLAEKVLPYITALSKKMKQEVILLRVFSVPIQTFGEDAYMPRIDQIAASIREEARGYLGAKVEQLQAEGLEKVSDVLLEGDAAEQIIDFARKTPDNTVAMCTHGRSGAGRWMLGSVTERVVRHSGDPVLVIRASVAL